MSWGFVQAQEGYLSNGTTLTITFTSNCTTNNRIIVAIGLGNNVGSTINTISDGAGNTYNQDITLAGINTGYIYSANVTSGGGTKIAVTVTVTGGPDDMPVWILEYSGLSTATNAVDVSGSTDSGGTASTTHSATTSASTTANNELVFFFNHDDGAGGSQTAGSGLTLRGTDTTNAYTTSVGDKIGTSGATQTGSVTTGNSITYTCYVVVYKLAPPGVVSAIGVIFPRIQNLPTTPVVGLGPATFYLPQNPPVIAPAAAAPVLTAKSILKITLPTPKSKARVAGAGPLAARSINIKERLVAVVATPKSRAKAASVVSRVLPPAIRGRLIVFFPGFRARARVAGTGPLAAMPTGIRERLVAVVTTPKSKSKLAFIAGPAAQPITIRERLVAFYPNFRARARIAGPGPAAGQPVTVRERLVRVLAMPKSRAVYIASTVLTSQTARQALKRSLSTPRSRAQVAGTGLAALPGKIARQALKFPILVRRAIARVATIFIPPPVGFPGTVTVADRQVNTVPPADVLTNAVGILDAQTDQAGVADLLPFFVTVRDQLAPQVGISDTVP